MLKLKFLEAQTTSTCWQKWT